MSDFVAQTAVVAFRGPPPPPFVRYRTAVTDTPLLHSPDYFPLPSFVSFDLRKVSEIIADIELGLIFITGVLSKVFVWK